MADKKLHVLYVPGLGDASVAGQRLAVSTWQLWGVQAELVQMRWDDTEVWDSKLTRLLGRIDALVAEGVPVALIGASAGASAVMSAYALRASQVAGCVLLAGKVNNAHTIGTGYRQKNPAFVDSARQGEKSLASLSAGDLARILSRYSTHDQIVSKSDSHIEGATNEIVHTMGHALTIGSQLVFGAPSFLGFLKAAAKEGTEPISS